MTFCVHMHLPYSNHTESVLSLLEMGAEVREIGEDGSTLLHGAALLGNSAVIRALATFPGMMLDALVSWLY